MSLFPAMRSRSLPDTFTFAQARKAGLSKHEIYRRRDAGEFEMLSRGLFQLAGAEVTDLQLIEIALRTPRATLCLNTALARHELTDEIPPAIDVAIPRGTRTPTTPGPARWHHFDAATFDLGRELLPLTDEVSIGVYSAERCIIDAFRMRGSGGYETPIEALKSWLRRRGSQPSKLLAFAKRFPRATAPIQNALEILL